jgi:hypothetical protein
MFNISISLDFFSGIQCHARICRSCQAGNFGKWKMFIMRAGDLQIWHPTKPTILNEKGRITFSFKMNGFHFTDHFRIPSENK